MWMPLFLNGSTLTIIFASEQKPHAARHSATREWSEVFDERRVRAHFLVGQICAADEYFPARATNGERVADMRIDERVAIATRFVGGDTILIENPLAFRTGAP